MGIRALVKKAAVALAAATVAATAYAPHGEAIVNGYTAPPGTSDFVAQVTMMRDTDGDGRPDRFGGCTGSLVHPTWVLTAAHCFNSYQPADAAVTYRVRIGNQDSDKGIERRSVDRVLINPSYMGSGNSDVALMRLTRPSYMTRLQLATPAFRAKWTTSPATDAVYGFATGWGRLSSGGATPQQIQRVLVRLAASDTDAFGVTRVRLDGAANAGRGTCSGDSGGPLLVRTDNDELRAVGVLRGGNCPGNEDYSEVGAGQNRDWIRAQIADIDAPAPPSQYESWRSFGAPVSGGGCGSNSPCQVYRSFDYAPAVASFGDIQRVFVVTNGTIHTRTRTGQTWSDWTALDGYVTAKPAAVMTSSDSVDLFARGGDNRLYRKQMRFGTWRAWELMGGTLTSGPAAAVDGNGRIHVFVRGGDNGVWQLVPGFTGWTGRGGYVTSELGAASMGGSRVDVFARGGDNRLWQLVVDGSWGAWYGHDGVLGSGPAVVSRGQNMLDVFVLGTDRAVYHKAWDGHRWLPWNSRGGFVTADPAAALGTDEAVELYVRGGDAGLWNKAA